MWGIDLKVRDYIILKNILENNYRYSVFIIFLKKKKEFLFNIDILNIEFVYINLGLLVLGNVISVLGDFKKKVIYISYREFKIIRFFKVCMFVRVII